MAVVFVDAETGEVLADEAEVESPRRAARRASEPVPEKRERPRQSLWPVVVVFVAILSFLIGGGLANSFSQQEIHNLKMQLDYPDVP
jgi:hypothetical protein